MAASSENSILLSSGYRMPVLGLGTWQSSKEEETTEAIKTAIEIGYRHIDTAYAYQNEAFIGKTLKSIFEKGILKRNDIFVVTKLPMNGMAEDSVEYFLKKSLRALQLDYVDLYLVHSPLATERTDDDDAMFPKPELQFVGDPNVDLVKTWKVMEKMVDKGLTRSIGVSNFNSKQIQRIVDNARIKPANVQVECHAYFPQFELQEFCRKLNISFTAYAPLGTPGLAQFMKEKMNTEVKLPKLMEDPKVVAIAKKHGKTAGQVLIRYLVQRGIIVIPKSANPKRIKENFEVFDYSLSDEDMKILKSLDKHFRFFTFEIAKGIKEHPEFPFNEPY